MDINVPTKTSMYIFYTGCGCKRSHHHTVNEFVQIMEQHYGHQYYETLKYIGAIEEESQNGDNSYFIWLTDMYYNYNKWVDFAGANIIGEITPFREITLS